MNDCLPVTCSDTQLKYISLLCEKMFNSDYEMNKNHGFGIEIKSSDICRGEIFIISKAAFAMLAFITSLFKLSEEMLSSDVDVVFVNHETFNVLKEAYKCMRFPKAPSQSDDFSNSQANQINNSSDEIPEIVPEKKYDCLLCGKNFTSLKNYNLHIQRSHTKEKTFKCQLCNKSFKYSSDLLKHNVIHTDVKLFHCNFCDKKFRTKTNQKVHEQSHKNNKKYVCENCGKGFSKAFNLRRHLETAHSKENIKTHHCNLCQKSFSSNFNLNRHKTQAHNYFN